MSAKTKPEKQVAEALARLAAKRIEIEGRRKKKPQWASSCRVELPGWPAVTIQVERQIPLLILVLGTLRRLGEDLASYEMAEVWDGFPIASWIQDLKQRVAWLRDDEDLRRLAHLETQVKPLQTEGQKRAVGIDALAGSLAELLD